MKGLGACRAACDSSMNNIANGWEKYLLEQYALKHSEFMKLSDDVRDALFFVYIWMNIPRAEECDEKVHQFFEHYNPLTTELYRCCYTCVRTQYYDRGWESYSFARFFELLESVCWAALEYRFWRDENKRCMQQVNKILEIG